MIDAFDLAVVVPFRADSKERLENLEAAVKALTNSTRNLELLLTESGQTPAAAHLGAWPTLKYEFERDTGPFHKTRLLNKGLSRSSRAFVASYDADTLLFPSALELALQKLRAGAGIVLPFSGDLFDLRRSARRAAIRTASVEMFSPSYLLGRRGKLGFRDLFQTVYLHDDHVGGAVIFNREVFESCGGYNENFISWGYEDNEIVERFRKLGVKLEKIAGYPALHLWHRRGPDSGRPNPYFRANVREYERIAKASADEVRKRLLKGELRLDRRPPVAVRGRAESFFWGMLAKLGIR